MRMRVLIVTLSATIAAASPIVVARHTRMSIEAARLPSQDQTPTSATVTHPLDPLTAPEIETAAAVLSGLPQFPKSGEFAALVLKEPPKADVLAFQAGAPIARQAFAVVLDRPTNRTFEAVV